MDVKTETAVELVFRALDQHEQMPISDLERLLASTPTLLGFGVEPHHVIGDMLQYGQLEYGATIKVVRTSGPERLKQKGALYFAALTSFLPRAAQMEELANGPEKMLYDAIKGLCAVYGNRVANIF